jgi:hypothetical protein
LIATTCPECTKVVTFSESFSGRRSPCPSCRKLIPVPTQSTVAPPPAALASRPAALAQLGGEVIFETNCPSCRVPGVCACCMGAAETEVQVTWERRTPVLGGTKVERVDFPFPYCHRCAKHVKWYERSWTIAIVVAMVSFFVILCNLPFAGHTDNEKAMFALLAIIGGVGLMFLTRLVFKLCQPPTGPGCSTDTKAVHCTPNRPNAFRFRFTNREFGRQFTELNS